MNVSKILTRDNSNNFNPNINNNTNNSRKTPQKSVINAPNDKRVSHVPNTTPTIAPTVAKTRHVEKEGIMSPKNWIVEKLHAAIYAGNLDEVKRIVEEAQIKINARDSAQNTPLHSAIIADKFDIASYLVSEGVNPSLANEVGNTPLHLACTKPTSSYLVLVLSATTKFPSGGSSLPTSASTSSIPQRGVLRVPAAYGLAPSPSAGSLPPVSMSMASIVPPLGVFLNKANSCGNTALHVACFHGNVGAAKILLSKNAENQANLEGWTPLHHAAAMGHHAIIGALLTRSPPPSLDCRDAEGRSPLLLAAANGHTDSVLLLTKAGANLNAVSESGDSPLHLAIRHAATQQTPLPDLSLIETLLNQGALVGTDSKTGNTPLHVACLYGASSIVDLLLKHKQMTKVEVNRLTTKAHTPLHLAVSRPGYHHYTPYQGTREKDRLSIVKSLIAAGAAINKRKKETGKGKSLLHSAARNGYGEIVHYLTSTIPPPTPQRRPGGIATPPLSRKSSEIGAGGGRDEGVDLTTRDNVGRTPLHYAAMAGSEACVNVFMRSLAAKLSLPNMQDADGATPLHLAALYGRALICEVLIRESEVPGLVHIPDANGNTPLHLAAWGKNVDAVEAILLRGGMATQANAKYQTPLHLACAPPPPRKLSSYSLRSNWISDTIRICTILLEYGADIHAEDEQGWTPLDFALATPQAHLPSIPPPTPADTTNFASPSQSAPPPSSIPLQFGSSPPATHTSSPTPTLSIKTPAVEDEPISCISQFLLQCGANTHTRDVRLDHGLHRAVAGGCAECVRALLEQGEDVEAMGAKDRSPLHVAAALGYAPLINILLEYGANPHSRTTAHLTPLHQAARHGSLVCAELLLARGGLADARCARAWTPLHHACAMGHSEVATLLVENGADVNSTDATGRTPLHKATYYSHPECVMLLVERGAKPNAEDEDGETPIHYASIRGLSAALIFMSAVGADLALPTKKGSTPIHLAARYGHVDTAMFLIEKDPLVLAAVTQKGRSPLHVAARYGKDDMTRVLLEHGADCNATDIYGNTPLHMAAKGGSVAVVSHLLGPYTHRRGASPNSPNMHGITPLHLCALCSHTDLLVQLIEGGAELDILDNMGRSPLTCALQALNVSCASKLLEMGCRVDGVDEDGRTLLHVAVLHNALSFVRALLYPTTTLIPTPFTFTAYQQDADANTALHTAASVGAVEIARLLLQHAAEGEEGDMSDFLEQGNVLGRTALHIASFYGHLPFAEFLLSMGADIEAQDLTHSTPLHLCGASGQDPSLLLQHGADPGAVNDKGYAVIHTAASGGSVRCVEQILEMRPEDINSRSEEGDTPLHIAVRYGHAHVVSTLLAHNTESLDVRNNGGASPLHLAALHGRTAILTLLLDNLANLNLPDLQGRRPLHFAAMSNHKDCALILLRRGANPSQPDSESRTALHLAAARGQKVLVSLLLAQNGVDPNTLDNEEATALAYAQANGHLECVELLRTHGMRPPPIPRRLPTQTQLFPASH